MGYVRTALAKPGTPLQLGVRSRRVDTAVTKMPFVPSNYYHLKRPHEAMRQNIIFICIYESKDTS